MGIPDHLTCLLKNLYAGQEAIVRTRHGTTDWFKIWKTQQWPQDWKRSVFIPIPKKGNTKESLNYCTVVLISHACQVMLKILQGRLQQYVNRELPEVQADFRKGKGTKDQIANISWIIKNQDSSRKISTFALLTMPKPLTVWITTNSGKFLRI